MNILLTGGLGFIGHNVAAKLESLGNFVAIVDNETDYGLVPQDQLRYLVRARRAKLRTPHIYNYDIRNRESVDSVMNRHQIDTVIHFAGYPRQKIVNADPQNGGGVLTIGLLNLLELAVKYKVEKFVYISSSMVYGDFDNDVTEDAECCPQGQYAILKYTGELLVRDYTRRRDLSHIIVRPSAVYGPLDMEDRVVSKFLIASQRGQDLAVMGRDQILDFTYIDDVVQGIVLSCTRPVSNRTYNITRSSTRLYTLLDAAKLCVEMYRRGRILVYDRDHEYPRRGRLCIDRAREELGFDPKIDLEQGLELYRQWLESSVYWQQKL